MEILTVYLLILIQKMTDGNKLYGKEALKKTIELGERFENEFCQYLKETTSFRI